MEFITQQLKKHDLKVTPPRVMVLEYLYHHPMHPTVEEIYLVLKKKISTLSKTTMYNTLNRFVEVGLVSVIRIAEQELRYDLIQEPHGHFMCVKCNSITNFKVPSMEGMTNDLQGFQIADQQWYFKGICPTCLQTTKKGGLYNE